MRLLYLTDRLSHRGGAPNHLLDLIRGMAEHHSVMVASAGIDSNVVLPANVTHFKVAGLRAGTPQQKGLNRLADLLKQAELVHLQNIMNPTAIEQAKTRPCVATIQDHRVFCPGPGRTLPSGERCVEAMKDAPCENCLPDPDQRARMISLTEARRSALLGIPLIVLSTYMADEMELAGHPRPQIIPPPIEVGPPKTEVGAGFLLAGRLVHHKGIDFAYRAWKLSKTEQPLRIAGLGPASNTVPEAELLGWLDASALREQLRSARALLFPARWQEPYGILGVEALAMGTPVIAMKRGGIPDWAEAGTITVQPGDVAGMAAAIHSLSVHPQIAHQMGRTGQQFVRQQNDARNPIEQIQALYTQTAQTYIR